MQIPKFIFPICILLAALSACEKENYTNWSIAENTLNAQEVAMDIFTQTQYLQDKYYSYFTDNCAQIQQHNSEDFTLDFGINCFGEDARIRSGKWFMHSNTFSTVDASRGNHLIQIDFDDYEVHKFFVKGSMVFEFNNQTPNKIFYLKADNVQITLRNNEVIYWTANQTFTQTKGQNSIYLNDGAIAFEDDVYQIEGYSFYRDSNNNKYENTIIKPLEKKLNCRWITSGNMSLDIGAKEKQLLDFGDSSCDNTTIISIDRWSTAIHTFQ